MFDIEPFIQEMLLGLQQEMLLGLQQAAIEILRMGGSFMVLGIIISIIISSGRK